MLVLPIQDMIDPEKCYQKMVFYLHPEGLRCPRCRASLPGGQKPHKVSSQGTPSFKCRSCGCVHNLFSRTIFQGAHYSCTLIYLMLRGFLEGKTTQHLHKELQINYSNLLDWRHHIQANCFGNRDLSRLPDAVVESDEVFVNAGEKGVPHPCPDDPPRRRANKKRLRHF